MAHLRQRFSSSPSHARPHNFQVPDYPSHHLSLLRRSLTGINDPSFTGINDDAVAMGAACSTSKLAPEEQLDVPAKPVTVRRGLFGRSGWRNSGHNAAADDRRSSVEQQQPKVEEIKVVCAEPLARSPGSPSFRHYCGDVVAAAIATTECKEERS
ncbi:hypothetical protein PR202_gb13512 [Eleusine coracana subsp. coracana]|uniref:Uncharacterized protein n=1 Tax=Eleusine coracana subsp. coracana TaxID=191504 RepID=A0AAV5ESU3_ELECO|nr:hypothetical protein PR202_gb13512 [Eleusine coracana subsp. coracana]